MKERMSQSSMQSRWYVCMQGRNRMGSPYTKSIIQITHAHAHTHTHTLTQTHTHTHTQRQTDTHTTYSEMGPYHFEMSSLSQSHTTSHLLSTEGRETTHTHTVLR